VPHNKQLQRAVIPNRWRAASAPLHYAHAARWTRDRAAAGLRRFVTSRANRSIPRLTPSSRRSTVGT
jgi:hypothetical protein